MRLSQYAGQSMLSVLEHSQFLNSLDTTNFIENLGVCAQRGVCVSV